LYFSANPDLATRYGLPSISIGNRSGLISYGPSETEQVQGAAGYIDRILKGEKPADLPIQLATKFRLTMNLKTAKALGLTIPEPILLTADEVIE
jgi:putative ABC transport system substrate-binding protein